MIQIECTLFKKIYNVKKICRYRAEMPRNAKQVFTAYTSDIDKTIYWIYSTDSGILYAKKSPCN